MRDMNRYIDQWGLIVQDLNGYSKGDAGDACHKTSHLAIANYLNGQQLHSSFQRLIEVQKATPFVRHPDSSKWYSRTDRMSRDQSFPYVIALALLANFGMLFHFFIRHALHLFLFTWNYYPNYVMPGDTDYKRKMPDITLFEFFNVYIRGFRLYPLYPLLLIGDLEMLGSCLIKRYDSDKDVCNSLASVLLAKEIMPTPLSYLARKILKPVAQRKLDDYFREDWMEPPINEFYRPSVDKM